MKKEYANPTIVVVEMELSSLICTSQLKVGDGTLNADQALSPDFDEEDLEDF